MLPVAHILQPIIDAANSVLEFFAVDMSLGFGVAIILLTFVTRIVILPLSIKQIKSMRALQAYSPQIKELNERYKDDPQRKQREMMNFYKENNINPASSCLPLVAQIPIFIGLFFTLRNFAKEAEIPGHDLGDLSWLHFVPSVADEASAHWSGWVLIAIYVLSQLASTYFMSGTMQKSQRVLMMILPFVFIPFIVNFPTGLVLYWMTTNLWTVGQGLITRRLIPKVGPPGGDTGPKRSSRTPPKGPQGDGATAAEEPPDAQKPSGPPRRVKRKKKARR